MKMSKVALWFLVITIASFIIAGGLFFETGGFRAITSEDFGQGSENIDERKTFSISDINNIEVDTTSTDITFIQSDSDEIEIHFYGRASGNIPWLETDIRGNTLKIDIRRKHQFIIGFSLPNMNKLNLDVYLPQNYKEDLGVHTISGDAIISGDSLNNFIIKSTSGNLNIEKMKSSNSRISTISGDVSIKDFSCNKFELSTTSGDLKAQNMSSSDTSIRTTSGDISIDDYSVEDFEFITTSGNFKAYNLETTQTYLKTISGEVTIQDFNGDLEFQTTSGDVYVEYLDFNNEIKGKTSSGEVSLALPKDPKFLLNFESVSGKAKVDFPITVERQEKNDLKGTVGIGGNKININTISGDLEINK